MGRYLRLKFHVRGVVDYTDMQFLNFVIKYLCKNEKIGKTALPCSSWAQIESFEQKKLRLEILFHCPFIFCSHGITYRLECEQSSGSSVLHCLEKKTQQDIIRATQDMFVSIAFKLQK